MFALHYAFRTEAAVKAALSGVGEFKPAQLALNHLARSQGLFCQCGDGSASSKRFLSGPPHWHLISSARIDPVRGITFICLVCEDRPGKSADGVHFVDVVVGEREFGPFAADDLLLIAARPVSRPRSHRIAGDGLLSASGR
ncbi:MAG: hypothetical protein KGS72_24995 [Cyanobacteria bacterium REEB67]|nr:hypothetical protein [Cyanobacteria bacterium REEB67]